MKVYLKTTLTAALFFGCLLGAQEAYADGECDSLKKLKDSYNKAIADEKAGKLIDAFKEYGTASSKWGCEGQNLAAGDAEKGWKRVGQRLGAEAEKKGNLYNKVDLYGKDAAAAGAFEWYTAIESPADADRVMVKFAKSKPKDMEILKFAVNHFTKGREEKLKVKEGKEGYFKELEKIAVDNGNSVFAQEEKAFDRKEVVAGQMGPVEESMHQLTLARKWFAIVNNEEGEKKVVGRAEKRGDTLYQDNKEPLSLGEAIEYYKITKNSEKINKVKEKANRLGDAAFKNNDLVRAIAYYEIAGNKAKAREAEALQKEKGKKQVDEMLRDDERKKKFKKEQKDLEKELGM